VSQAVLVGDGRPYCVALVTVDERSIRALAKKQGNTVSDGGGSESDERVKSLIWEDVEKVNAGLASYESVKKIAVVPEEFTVENGLLTPTFKVKRRLVEGKYMDLIESLYG